MSHLDEIRLMAKVARMYYDYGVRQKEITTRLGLHQSTVSRLLQKARDNNIVRITVASPPGIFAELEDALGRKFGLEEAVVVDTPRDHEHHFRELGAAAAFFVETTVKPMTIIGISSWSRTLLAMVDAMHSTDSGRGGKVVQLMGGVGSGQTQYYATHLVQKLASLIGAEPVLLQAPGIVDSVQARRVLCRDISVRRASDLFDRITLAIVGIGAMEPSPFLVSSGNAFSPSERREIHRQGAVGDLCLRFYDRRGKPIKSTLNSRVIGIDLETLRKVRRVVAVAGGTEKIPAILAALWSRRINVLITDRQTAERLLEVEVNG